MVDKLLMEPQGPAGGEGWHGKWHILKVVLPKREGWQVVLDREMPGWRW